MLPTTCHRAAGRQINKWPSGGVSAEGLGPSTIKSHVFTANDRSWRKAAGRPISPPANATYNLRVTSNSAELAGRNSRPSFRASCRACRVPLRGRITTSADNVTRLPVYAGSPRFHHRDIGLDRFRTASGATMKTRRCRFGGTKCGETRTT